MAKVLALPQSVKNDQLPEAHTATLGAITRLLLTLVVFGAFCILTLAAPDRLMLFSKTSEASVELPFAGLKVSFFIFLIVGPAILIALRAYLYIHIVHLYGLETEIQNRKLTPRPTLSHFDQQFLRLFVGFLLYTLVPIMEASFREPAMRAKTYLFYVSPATRETAVEPGATLLQN